MKRYWGAFVLHGNPAVPGQAAWPRYDTRSVVLSLRPGGRSATISDATLRAEHQCAFWAAHPTQA
jgi:para-nitrobenzyl esterase